MKACVVCKLLLVLRMGWVEKEVGVGSGRGRCDEGKDVVNNSGKSWRVRGNRRGLPDQTPRSSWVSSGNKELLD